jgi:hypothetical protein
MPVVGSAIGAIPIAVAAGLQVTRRATGSYTLSGTVGGTPLGLRCAGADTVAKTAAVGTLDFNSAGTYTNIVCGMGTADSSGNTVVGSSTLAGDSAITAALVTAVNDPTTQYGITFTAGQGVFKWKAGGKISGLGGPTDGVISITAAGDGGPTPPNCTNHFTVAGVITAAF